MTPRNTDSPPKMVKWLLQRMTSYDDRYGSIGDFEEDFKRITQKSNPGKARSWFWSQVFQTLPRYCTHLIYWRMVMIQNYLRIAWRLLTKQKGYSLINILGLAIGLAACLFIFLYIHFETGYDTYHPGADRLYRVAKSNKSAVKTDLLAANVTEVAPTLKERFPEVELAARAGSANFRYIQVGAQKYLHDKLVSMDPEMLRLFTIPLVAGDPATALDRHDALLLTTGMARKYFGSADPMGQTVFVDSVAHTVTGVLANCPGNTHLKYDLIQPLILDPSNPFHQIPWFGWHCMNYIRLVPGVDVRAFEEKIRRLPHEYQDEFLKQRGVEFTLFLQPVKDIHLHSHLSWEMEPPGNAASVTLFGAVGIFILLIACMNFMNLSTARSAMRAGEVGLRKVVGARRGQLAGQFLGESLLMIVLSMALALALVIALLGAFNGWAGTELHANVLLSPTLLLFGAGLLLFTSLAAGGYPAFVLSALRPTAILRGYQKPGARGTALRKLLVLGQFAISIALIAGTLLFHQQLRFMKDHPLGFSKEQKLVIEFNREVITQQTAQRVKDEFSAHPGIQAASFSSSVPGRWMYYWNMTYSGGGQEGRKMMNAFCVDDQFFETYDIELMAGRGFAANANRQGWVINQAAVAANGWADAETALQGVLNDGPIRGVMKDFHFRGLQQAVEPLAIFSQRDDFRYLTLVVDVRQAQSVLAFVDETHKRLFPGNLYETFFLDRDFEAQYQADEQRAGLFMGFAALGILIACLGLLGLSAFIAQQRTKEVGIRKVLGASLSSLVIRLTREFTSWVLLANLIAWPVAWWGMNRWLNDFAYRIRIGIGPFIIAAALSLAIAFLTVAYQAIRAGQLNPVEALRNE